MRCPACPARTSLAPIALDGRLLPAHRCAACAGQFVRGEQFYRWIDHPDRRRADTTCERESPYSTQTGSDAVLVDASPCTDSPRAKICPQCGKLMSRYRVGRGVRFALDRCVGCGGIWFDADEWETLVRLGLSDRVHFIFSRAWQAGINREQSAATQRSRLAERLGGGDLAEIDRIVGWIERHPRRSEIVAYVLGHLSPEPRESSIPRSEVP